MTVKELKKKLDQFSENYVVLIPCEDPDRAKYFPFTPAKHISQGFNELDGCIIIDDYVED